MRREDLNLAARLAAAEAAIEGLPEPEQTSSGLHPTVFAWIKPLIRLPARDITMLIVGRWRGRIIPPPGAVWTAMRLHGVV